MSKNRVGKYVKQTWTKSKFVKTEVMWVGHRRTELEMRLDGKKLKQRDSFVNLGGAICGDGNVNNEIRRRITAGQTVGGNSKG